MPGHTRGDIERFLAHERIALVGVSRDARHFSRLLWREFRARGYELIPVNPAMAEVDGAPCYRSVEAIEPPVEAALVVTPAHASARVVADCARAGVKELWLYRGGPGGSVSEAALAVAAAHGMKVIVGECPFMFLPNAGWFHSLHRGLRWISGRLPRREAAGDN
jgi:predicted CoA-binding protein